MYPAYMIEWRNSFWFNHSFLGNYKYLCLFILFAICQQLLLKKEKGLFSPFIFDVVLILKRGM
jgi:hypothetical protein